MARDKQVQQQILTTMPPPKGKVPLLREGEVTRSKPQTLPTGQTMPGYKRK